VDEMAVDVEKGAPAGEFCYDVRVPNLVEEGCGHELLSYAPSIGRRPRGVAGRFQLSNPTISSTDQT